MPFVLMFSVRFQVVELSSAIADEALELTRRHPLRAYDAVQLASALATNRLIIYSGANPLIFLCADRRLLAVAQAEGLNVDNPDLH
jgi:predicted nucleic acid-binding protein